MIPLRFALACALWPFAASAAEPLPINPAVTQDAIQQTICRSGWTREIRPAPGVARAIKHAMLREIGAEPHSARRYELDHKIPLALGGAPLDRHNLALQPIHAARRKDAIETCLSAAVCGGQITLDAARTAIWTNWRAAGALCRRSHREPSL